MKKRNKIVSVVLALCLCLALLPMNVFATGDYEGKTVVIYTGNIRGNVDVLPLIASARADFEAKGADVILVDTGNFLQGTRYGAFNSGSTIITLMIAAGYDVVALGTYDFAFGTGALGTAFHGDAVEFGPLGELLEMNPAFRAVSANISGENEFFHSFTENTEIETNSGISIGFFGLINQAIPNIILESNLAGLQFVNPANVANVQVSALTDNDLIIGLSNASAVNVNGAIMIENTSTSLSDGVTVGAIIIDNETLEYTRQNINLEDFESHVGVLAAVNEFKAVVDSAFARVGRSNITLNGSTDANRSGETNLGNFWADALRWFAVSGEINEFFDEDDVAIGNNRIHVEANNVVALWNAGNLRDYLYTGDVTIQDLRRVLPFPNTVAVIYLTGAELLEQLEASSQGLPYSVENFALAASLMHVSGIEYVIDTNIEFNAGEAHMGRIWHRAESVERVTITSINGSPFDETAIYAVITSNANFNGMDISYVLNERVSDTENRSTITTARVVDNAVMGYILSLPNTTIEAAHATLDGRMTVIGTEEVAPTVSTSLYNDVIPTDWFYTAVNFVTEQKLMSGANGLFSPNEYVTRGMFAEILYDLAGIYPIANRPDEYLTRQEMAVFMFQYFGSTPVEGSLSFDDADDIAYWAYDAVVYSFVNGLLRGVSETTFAPNQLTTRAQLATVLARMLAE